MKLILTRHGETIENAQDIHQGQKIGGTLSKLGLEQAKRLGIRLKDEEIDVIYSSDLSRAADTAKEIAKHYPKVPFILTKELRERDSSTFGGKHHSEIDFKNPPPDAETKEDLQIRAKGIIDEAYMKHHDKIVLFVSHGAFNRALMSVILDKPMGEIEGQKNTAINIFELKENKNHKIHLFNCTKHLA